MKSLSRALSDNLFAPNSKHSLL
uniref:Uncharacterized protein n=1 Tax=Rhizophora mucronata TaxID=61149 RepID=A0A2P2KQ84_RHIMU